MSSPQGKLSLRYVPSLFQRFGNDCQVPAQCWKLPKVHYFLSSSQQSATLCSVLHEECYWEKDFLNQPATVVSRAKVYSSGHMLQLQKHLRLDD